jgi:multicomponent Na+:H+ antiporter subunit D
MTALLVLPILVPLATAAALLLFWRRVRAQASLSIAGSVGLLAAAVALMAAVRRSGIQAVQIGGWHAPFGITFVADLLAAIMVLLAATIGLAVVVYSGRSIGRGPKAWGYHPLLHLLLAGVCGAFLTGDIFNLYVWFEVMLISSLVLLALGGGRAQLEGALEYVTLDLMSSAMFLAGAGLQYGLVGTLNMAHLAVRLAETGRPALGMGAPRRRAKSPRGPGRSTGRR